MSLRMGYGVRLVGLFALVTLAGACSGGAPPPPGGKGGNGGAGLGGKGAPGGSGVGGAGAGGAAGASGVAGAAGGAAGGGNVAGAGGTSSAGGTTATGAGGAGGAVAVGGAGGGGGTKATGGADGSLACTKALFGRYLLRNDGALLYEADPPSTAQTPVLDAGTGLPLVDLTGVQDGGFHGCAVQSSTKTVWCWRTGMYGNVFGQLGNGMTDSLTTAFQATQVLTAANKPLTNVVAVADQDVPATSGSSGDAACAVTGDGNLYCWGTLTYLANGGTALMSTYATAITTDGITPLAGVLRIGLFNFYSGSYACAITQGTSSKQVWCWGNNSFGNLGLGDLTLRPYPTKVLGISNPLKILANGGYGTTCVLDGSNVRCWGYNGAGGTGTGTTNSPLLAPALVTLTGGTSPLDGVVDLHGGDESFFSNFCALTTTNTLVCWGDLYQSYPTAFGVTNVVLLGGTGYYVRYLTSDGMYHVGTASDHVGTARAPNCGPLH